MTYAATASHAALRQRAEILRRIRAFFAERGVLEVETPALSRAGVSDLGLESVVAHARSLGSEPLYLHTSPEYAMKRLLAAGIGDIYQLCRVYRDDELGRWHQPEFTLLEWYRVGWDDRRLMDEVEALLETVLGTSGDTRRAERLSYDQALRQSLGVAATADPGDIDAKLKQHGIDVPAGLARDGLLDLAFSTVVMPSLARDVPTFIYDFPSSQAALAKIKPGDPPVAARFEAFADGIELANGFEELTDAAEQRRRFEHEVEERRRSGRMTPPLDEEFLAALAHLPPCAGVAVGVDRLVALALGAADLAAAVSFVHRR